MQFVPCEKLLLNHLHQEKCSFRENLPACKGKLAAVLIAFFTTLRTQKNYVDVNGSW